MNAHNHTARLMSHHTQLPTQPRTPAPNRRPLLPLPPRTNSAPSLVKGGICEFHGIDSFRVRLAMHLQSLGRKVRTQHPRRTAPPMPPRTRDGHLEDTHGDPVFVLEHLPHPMLGVCPFCAAEFMDVTNYAVHLGSCPMK